MIKYLLTALIVFTIYRFFIKKNGNQLHRRENSRNIDQEEDSGDYIDYEDVE